MSYLKISKLYKKYQDNIIFDNVNISFDSGIYEITGPNGSGKTTLLKIIKGSVLPETAEIVYNDKTISNDTLLNITAYSLPNQKWLYDKLTLLDNIYFYLKLYSYQKSKSELADKIYEYFPNIDFTKKGFKGSAGEGQICLFLITLLSNRQILLFDEPVLHLDEENLNTVKNILTDNNISDKIIIICNTTRTGILSKHYNINDLKQNKYA